MGLIDAADPIMLQLYVEPLQKFRLAAHGHGAVLPPDSARASGSRPISIRCRSGTAVRGGARSTAQTFPLHAITQRPMHMYHSWDSQNAWLRQIIGQNRLFMHRARRRGRSASPTTTGSGSRAITGRIQGQIRLMDGVNPDTVWTWNAIGKRAGAWSLDADAPEFRRGFLLNHLISELLPPRWRLPPRQRRPDHRPGGVVRSARAHREGDARSRPAASAPVALRRSRIRRTLGPPPRILRYGAREGSR